MDSSENEIVIPIDFDQYSLVRGTAVMKWEDDDTHDGPKLRLSERLDVMKSLSNERVRLLVSHDIEKGPVGKVHKLRIEPSGALSIVMGISKHTAYGRDTLRRMIDGELTALSVGWLPNSDHLETNEYNYVRFTDISICSEPALEGCMITKFEHDGKIYVFPTKFENLATDVQTQIQDVNITSGKTTVTSSTQQQQQEQRQETTNLLINPTIRNLLDDNNKQNLLEMTSRVDVANAGVITENDVSEQAGNEQQQQQQQQEEAQMTVQQMRLATMQLRGFTSEEEMAQYEYQQVLRETQERQQQLQTMQNNLFQIINEDTPALVDQKPVIDNMTYQQKFVLCQGMGSMKEKMNAYQGNVNLLKGKLQQTEAVNEQVTAKNVQLETTVNTLQAENEALKRQLQSQTGLARVPATQMFVPSGKLQTTTLPTGATTTTTTTTTGTISQKPMVIQPPAQQTGQTLQKSHITPLQTNVPPASTPVVPVRKAGLVPSTQTAGMFGGKRPLTAADNIQTIQSSKDFVKGLANESLAHMGKWIDPKKPRVTITPHGKSASGAAAKADEK